MSSSDLAPVNPLVFPNRWGNRVKGTFLSELLRNLNIAAVPHGFRCSFRDWAAEETDHPREVIEAALAHVVRNRVEAAYAGSDLFERRRRLMDDRRPISRQPVVPAERPPEDGRERGTGGRADPVAPPVPSGGGRKIAARCARLTVAALCAATETRSPGWQGHTQPPRGRTLAGVAAPNAPNA